MPNLHTVYFVPQKDMTAYELASILSTFNILSHRAAVMTDEAWQHLMPEVKRHLTEERPR